MTATAKYQTCLLVDDSALDNFINCKIIKHVNFAEDIIAVEKPEEALEMLREGTVKPDIIFLDIRMPKMNGFDFLKEYEKIKFDKDHIKIFMLSSSLDPTDIARSRGNKYVTQYITKFLTMEVLRDLIEA